MAAIGNICRKECGKQFKSGILWLIYSLLSRVASIWTSLRLRFPDSWVIEKWEQCSEFFLNKPQSIQCKRLCLILIMGPFEAAPFWGWGGESRDEKDQRHLLLYEGWRWQMASGFKNVFTWQNHRDGGLSAVCLLCLSGLLRCGNTSSREHGHRAFIHIFGESSLHLPLAGGWTLPRFLPLKAIYLS